MAAVAAGQVQRPGVELIKEHLDMFSMYRCMVSTSR